MPLKQAEQGPRRLPKVLEELDAHPEIKKLAQEMFLYHVTRKASYEEIAQRYAQYHVSRQTVANYVEAYRRISYKYQSDWPVQDGVRFYEDMQLGLFAEGERPMYRAERTMLDSATDRGIA